MVKLENHLGVIDVSYDYLEGIVKNAAASCYGIAGLAAPAKKKSLLSTMLRSDPEERGVSIRVKGARLVIDLHIIVTYGMNISAIVKSITHKVRFAVEESTDFSVARVNVFIDGMKTH